MKKCDGPNSKSLLTDFLGEHCFWNHILVYTCQLTLALIKVKRNTVVIYHSQTEEMHETRPRNKSLRRETTVAGVPVTSFCVSDSFSSSTSEEGHGRDFAYALQYFLSPVPSGISSFGPAPAASSIQYHGLTAF